MSRKTKKRLWELGERVADLEMEMMSLLNRLFTVDFPSQQDVDMPTFEPCLRCGDRGGSHICTLKPRSVAPGFLEQSLRNQIAGLNDDD